MTPTHGTINEDTVLARLVGWAEARPAIRAMLLTSTRAIALCASSANDGAAVDALSDYDVVLVVDDIAPFYADRRWVEDFGEVLVAYWDPIQAELDGFQADGFEQFGNVIQYADGLKIDFTLWPVGLLHHVVASAPLPAEFDAGYRVLLDKDGLASQLPPPSYRAFLPTPPTNEVYQRWIEEFFSDAPYVAKCLLRDELLPAKWCLDYDMKHVYLRPVLEWRAALDANWSVREGNLGKGLKQRLPADIWAELEACYAGAQVADNWEALFRTIALFRRVAAEVGERLGYDYPFELDRRVTEYVAQLRNQA